MTGPSMRIEGSSRGPADAPTGLPISSLYTPLSDRTTMTDG